MKLSTIRPEYVDSVPKVLEDGVLYICVRYGTASHKCACGCGERVVTPLSPAEWRVIKDKDLVSMHPSIGNWDYACRSHYWIRKNRIEWARQFSSREIARVKQRDRADKARYIEEQNQKKLQSGELSGIEPKGQPTLQLDVRTRIAYWVRRLFNHE